MKSVPPNIRNQYQRFAQDLADIGWIASGNTFRRFLIRKIGGRDKKCGPYFSLTRKQDGKTITHALNESQFKLYSQAIANHRKADRILKKMRKLTVKFIQLSTPKLPSRNRSQAP